jgi:competence protein ComFC
VFKALWKNFINLIYPLSCLLCETALEPLSDRPVCAVCWNKIEYNQPPFCRVCAKHLPAKTQKQALICSNCQQSSFSFRQARSVCIYDGVIKNCLHLFKYKRKLSLVKPLSKLMIDFARNSLDMNKVDIIIPVPLYSTKRRLRQFNQAGLLAESISRACSKQLQQKLLIKTKPGPAQVELSKTERLKNLRGAFKVRSAGSLKDKNILLIDDVLTTGATANECARTLLDAQANSVDVLTLARSNPAPF